MGRDQQCLSIPADAVLDNVHSEGCRSLLAALARAAEARHEEFDGNAIGATLWGCTVAQQLPQSLLAKCAPQLLVPCAQTPARFYRLRDLNGLGWGSSRCETAHKLHLTHHWHPQQMHASSMPKGWRFRDSNILEQSARRVSAV